MSKLSSGISASKAVGGNRVRALIVIDDRPFRRGLGRELKALHKNLAKLQAEMIHHTKSVRPAYRAWYFDRFGDRATLVERLREEAEKKSMLLRRMQDLYSWRGFTRQRAFEQASEDLEEIWNPTPEEPSEPDEPAETDPEPEIEFDFEEPASSFTSAQFSFPGLDREHLAASAREKELKSIYRRLAQVLHPDRVEGEYAPSTRQLWHETQDAYQAKDLDRLKVLWAECLFAMDPLSGEVRLSDLQGAIARLQAQIKEAQKARRELSKTDPTWRFEKKNRDSLAREIARELVEAEADLRSITHALDREIKTFSGRTRRQADAVIDF